MLCCASRANPVPRLASQHSAGCRVTMVPSVRLVISNTGSALQAQRGMCIRRLDALRPQRAPQRAATGCHRLPWLKTAGFSGRLHTAAVAFVVVSQPGSGNMTSAAEGPGARLSMVRRHWSTLVPGATIKCSDPYGDKPPRSSHTRLPPPLHRHTGAAPWPCRRGQTMPGRRTRQSSD